MATPTAQNQLQTPIVETIRTAPFAGELRICKRDGKEVAFDGDKIRQAIAKAYRATGVPIDEEAIEIIVRQVLYAVAEKGILAVEEVQDIVERELMRHEPDVAKRYILYRDWRNKERHKRSQMKQNLDGIVNIEANDINLSNANMSAHTPAGQMMTFAAEVTKDYAQKYLLNPLYAQLHAMGDIHIHDLDYYPTKTTTCLQYDLEDLFERGFRTKNGSVRTPQSIQNYATLATIIFQTNQNEQHGGQAIPAFDFYLAPGVRKTFCKHIGHNLHVAAMLLDDKEQIPTSKQVSREFAKLNPSVEVSESTRGKISQIGESIGLKLSETQVNHILTEAIESTRRDTHQAMEGFIHNLNTMHSRGGNQVVFSSINYGTDTSPEGRMLVRELLAATEEGLGHGEVPIFPIQIFKVKSGVNFSENDFQKALADFDAALAGEIEFDTPNFDLFLESCRTTAHSLFPNFVFLDTPFNKDEAWRVEDPHRFFHEIATMGCRTRVYENVNGPRTSIGRGNLSFTSINMPRLAIEAKRKSEADNSGASKEVIEREAKQIFLASVRELSEKVAEQLYERYQYQYTALAVQFPFMMGNDVWKGGGKLTRDDKVGEVINQGTLGIGFIGGHNAMKALYGKGHAESEKAWETLYEALEVMNQVAERYKEKYHLNYSVLGTPAEGLAGRFTRMDQKRYGDIEGVTDRPYYVNSFHVDVCEPVTIEEKIRLEAPFHALTLGGHITYVELDGEAKKNPTVIMKIVKAMHDEGIGYGSINHPVDTCRKCGYKGVVYDKCPVCQSDQIDRLRRITGYLTGSLSSWNAAKQAEESDRVKHS